MSAQTAAVRGYGGAVHHYGRAGWDGVLPLEAGTKWPPPSGYTGHQGAWPDGKVRFDWTAAYRNGNLALRLPRGVIGIDVDCYGSKRGDLALAELEARYGPLPATWSSTSRGPDQPSRIWLYRCPEDLQLPGKLGDSIEAIQYHHRYTVAWPSTFEGRTYQWYDPSGRAVMRPPRPNELAWLPDDWHHLKAAPRPTIDYQPRAVDGDWSAAVTRYHAEGCAGLTAAGGRHDAMLPVVLTLVRLDGDGHPGAAEALDDLHGRFIAAVSDRSSAAEAEGEWARLEAGAADMVAVTPSLRGSYSDLTASRPLGVTRQVGDQLRTTPPPRQPEPDDAHEEQPDEDAEPSALPAEADEWDLIDLAEHVAGTFTRPRPRFLKLQ